MIEPDRARRLLGMLIDCLADLRRYRGAISREALRSQRDAQHMVLHALYVALQAAIDLAMHIGADEGLGAPASYQDAFHRLADTGVIEPVLARRLAGWAGAMC